MTAWAKPADLLLAHKYATPSEWRRHLKWYESEGYPWMAQLRKVLDEKADKPAGGEVEGRRRQAVGGIQAAPELAPEVPAVGDDLLA